MYIRKAEEKDLKRVAEIYEKILEREVAGHTKTGWLPGIYPTEDTASQAIERGDLYVMEIDGETAGSAVLNHMQVDCYCEGDWECECADSEAFVIHTLTIDPELSGKGFGKAFVEFYERLAREKCCRALRLDTNENNKAARGLYSSMGFKEVGIVPTVFNNIPGVNLVLIEKAL